VKLIKRKSPGPARKSLAASHVEGEGGSAAQFQLLDGRASTAQLQKTQQRIQLANKNSKRTAIAKLARSQAKLAKAASDRRVREFGANWEVLEISDYLHRHQLRQYRLKSNVGKTIMTLTDGSIILIDGNQYWRHESATAINAYYDSSHTINGDNTRTHFWTKKGHSLLNEA
jgi:hypothetical protein